MSDEMPSSQECKRRAIREIDGALKAPDSESQMLYYAEAQVWATLATVPEPLEAFEHSAVLDSTEPFSRAQLIEETFRHLPVAVCPHGYQASSSLIREPDKDPEIKISWYLQCPQGCP